MFRIRSKKGVERHMRNRDRQLGSTQAYRRAVARIIANVRLGRGLTDLQISGELNCSASTVSNARHEKTSLDPAILIRIESRFGPGAIDPYLALGNIRALQLDEGRDHSEPVLALVTALHLIIEAKSANSESGAKITDAELRKILPELRKGRAALDALISRSTIRQA